MKFEISPKAVIPIKIGLKKLEYYEGLLVKADNGLHNQIHNIVEYIFKDKKNISILDISAGEGALAIRLFNNGFKNICAVDINPKDFKFKNKIDFVELDLNSHTAVQDFIAANVDKYDLILGIETIEHLENPWSYMKLLKSVSKKNGIIMVTTPNINSIFSKISFILFDRFHQFSESDLEYFHINPISFFELYTICRILRLKIETVLPGGLYPIIWISKSVLFSIIYSVSNIFLYPFTRGLKYGWCCIYILKNENLRNEENDEKC